MTVKKEKEKIEINIQQESNQTIVSPLTSPTANNNFIESEYDKFINHIGENNYQVKYTNRKAEDENEDTRSCHYSDTLYNTQDSIKKIENITTEIHHKQEKGLLTNRRNIRFLNTINKITEEDDVNNTTHNFNNDIVTCDFNSPDY